MGKIKKILLSIMLSLCLVTVGIAPMYQVDALSVSTVRNLKTVSTTSSTVKIFWSKASSVSGYEVRRATSKSGTYKLIKTIQSSSTTSYTNSSLTSSKTYYYKVRAYKISNSKKYYGKYSSIVSATTKPSVMKAYKNFLEKNKYINGSFGAKLEYFALLDINKDNVKELLMVDSTERDVAVYTYVNGSVKYCGKFYDRGIVFIDASGRLGRRFTNSAVYMYYYLTLNSSKRLYAVSYTYDKVDKLYYKETGIADNITPLSRVRISQSQYDAAVKKAQFLKYISKYKNTSTNRSKYLK